MNKKIEIYELFEYEFKQFAFCACILLLALLNGSETSYGTLVV